MRGPLLMLAGIGLFGLLDAISKTLAGESHTVWQVLLVRFATILGVVALLRLLIRGWGGPLATRHPRIHAARAVTMLGSASFFFLAFSHLPLIEGYLVFFTSPFFVLALSALALREKVPTASWGWAAVGFGGVAIGLAPGLVGGVGGAAIGYLWALCGTLCYALVFTLNRSLRHEPGVARVLVWPAVLGFVVMLGPGIATWRAPEPWALALMMVNGVIVGIAVVALAESFRHASAARLAPVGYSGLLWSVTYDLAIWGHAPGWTMAAGAVVVVFACVMNERAAAPAREGSA